MRNFIVISLLASILSISGVETGAAQPGVSVGPTTKILAIGTVPAGTDPGQILKLLPEEARRTVDLYLDGKIDQWYSQQGHMGVVFVLDVTDEAVARDMLEKLPLGQAHLMDFVLMPLAPLMPLRRLRGMESPAP